MPKRITQNQKKEIINSFKNGKTIDQLSAIFNFTKATIVRHLKKEISINEYDQLVSQRKQKISLESDSTEETVKEQNLFQDNTITSEYVSQDKELPFIEIAPLNFDLDDFEQKDFSSIPLSSVTFPKVVYMIVDKKIELDIKFLRDYPEWDFLSENELSRKTIRIFADLKIAKNFCTKEQKVIKVPNTNVFKIAAPFLISKGISRIVSDDHLISF